MANEHTELDLEYDRKLLEDVFDIPHLRYVALYMFSLRKQLFQDMLDDTLIEEYEIIHTIKFPTKADLQRVCSPSLIKEMINFLLIKNIKSYEMYKIKPEVFTIVLDKGIQLGHEEIDELEEEVHLFVKENYLERLIRKDIPEMTRQEIHAALERMRAMMCPISSNVHELIHKFDDNYVLNDQFYYIIEELGNPFQALRIELMIRAMDEKYVEIENQLDKLLDQFHPNFSKAKIVNKFRKTIQLERKKKMGEQLKKERKQQKNQKPQKESFEKNVKPKHNKSKVIDPQSFKSQPELPEINKEKIDFVEKLKERVKKGTLPAKFTLDFAKSGEEEEKPSAPEIYVEWKKALNKLIKLKLEFDIINEKLDELRAYYSGKNQIMSYMVFIEKATFDEDNIGENVRKILLEARNSLKKISDGCNKYDVKDIKLLNLDLDRMVIEEGWDEEEEDD